MTRSVLLRRLCAALTPALLLSALSGCTTTPVPDTQVLTMKADASGAQSGFPPAGTVWRLDEQDLLTLSPAPYVPPPPQPIPAPRPETRRIYPPPPVGFHPYWGRGWPHYGSDYGFALRYGYPRGRYPYFW